MSHENNDVPHQMRPYDLVGETYCMNEDPMRSIDMSGLPLGSMHGDAFAGPYGDVATGDLGTSPPAFFGDFYADTNDVKRGVTLSAAPPPSGFGASQMDPYADSCHGLMSAMDPYGSYGGNGAFMGYDELLKGPSYGSKFPDVLGSGLGEIGALGGMSSTSKSAAVIGNESFVETDLPPDLPTDPFFQLEPCTIHVPLEPGLTAASVGNDLLELFRDRDEMIAEIIKVSIPKYAIKANVCIDGLTCMLKARAYLEAAGELALEFQRRTGDCVAFNEAFKRAVVFFKMHYPRTKTPDLGQDCYLPPDGRLLPAHPPAPLLLPSDAEAVGVPVEPQLSPLLDLADLAEIPSIRAEAAASLADAAAKSPKAAAQLCHGAAFGRVRKLLEADPLEIAHPTARLLLCLSGCEQAVQCFADEELLLDLVDKVRSQKTCAPVKEELAQVLKSAAGRCVSTLAEAAKCGVARALHAAEEATAPSASNERLRLDLAAARAALAVGAGVC